MNEASDIVLFLGRFHPLVVHLPIGFLLLGGLFAWMGRKEKYAALNDAVGIILLLGALSSIVAAILGYLLSMGGGYEESTLFWHKWLGIGVGVAAILAYILYKSPSFIPKAIGKPAYVGTFALMLGMLGYTGHLGGSLTHGSAYLTQYMPNGMRAIAGLPPRVKKERRIVTNLDSAQIFADVVQPIIEARCVSCHNENKTKGGLLMTSFASLMEGGKHGEVIKAGNAAQSELFHRVTLPEEDEHFMPPEGKKPLTDDQKAILEWWIASGAPEIEVLGTLALSEDIRPVLARELGLDAASAKADMLAGAGIPHLDESILNDLRAQGFRVNQVAQDNPFLDVDFSLSDTSLSSAQVKTLLKAKEQILWLNLGRTELDDAHLEVVGQLPNLMKLKLDNTPVSDVGIAHLSGLEKLEYLNLYGSKVGDGALETLKDLPGLKRVYLWQSQVSNEGAEKLKEARPDMMVDVGVQFTKVSN
ncbi:MAG: c-type cytochrome domain-containing protein [Bacteroidota bacterium]